jgi:hypothetical protein
MIFIIQLLNAKFVINNLLSPLKNQNTVTQQGVCHIVALPFTLKDILMQKKNYENSNISSCKNIIFKKSPKKTKILQDIITL